MIRTTRSTLGKSRLRPRGMARRRSFEMYRKQQLTQPKRPGTV